MIENPLIEQMAQEVLLLDAGDWQSLFELQQHCVAARDQLALSHPEAAALLAAMDQAIELLILEQAPADGVQAWLMAALEALQSAEVPQWPDLPPWLAPHVQAMADSAVTLATTIAQSPRDSDDPILQEFIQRSLATLDELQDVLLALEQGDEVEASLAAWRRTIHTIKGESGMLGLEQVVDCCAAIEESILGPPSAAVISALYHALAWLRHHLDPSQVETQAPTLSEVLAELLVGTGGTATTAQNGGTGFALRAEAAMLGEFVNEAKEHLENAEVQLLELDTNPGNSEAINALFRSFHTIKGLAGFMELDPVQTLAHETETFLDICRDRAVSSLAVDLVFEAIDGMKKLTAALREAVESGQAQMLIEVPLAPLCERMRQAVTDPMMFAGAAEVTVADGSAPRLGELLCDLGAVDEEAIAQALSRQHLQTAGGGSKPRLGEVLVREHVVEAKQISAALRQQRAGGSKPTAIRDSVKVDAIRLDRLVDAIGELVIAESMVSQDEEVQRIAQIGGELHKRINLLGKITRELQEIATSLRMTPIKGTFQRMARLARDVAGRTGKAVDFRTVGEDTELDKNVVDRIGDPLVHMVRNAIDHGLEADAAERAAAGKPSSGVVELKAFHQGGNICIQISDDGRGMDRSRLIAKAVDKGLVSAAEAAEWPDGDVYKLIFHPGFSTAAAVSDLSGRGVGMDVVKKTIAELRGQVDIDSTLGKGSTFTIRLPLTLAIIDGMVCAVGGERYIIPTLAITRSLRPQPRQLATALGQGEMLSLHGEVMPIFRLHRLLDVPQAQQDPSEALLVIIDDNERKAALMVDELLGKQQIVIKSLGNGLRQVPGIAGGAIMSDGSVGLIADPPALVALAHGVGD